MNANRFGTVRLKNAKVGFVAKTDSGLQVDDVTAEDVGTFYFEYSSEEELEAFKKLTESHQDELEELKKMLREIDDASQDKKNAVIKNSRIFEVLSAAGSAAAVFDFLIKICTGF